MLTYAAYQVATVAQLLGERFDLLTYAGVRLRMLTYADVYLRMLTYAAYQVATVAQLLRERFDFDEVQVSVCGRMLTYADVC